MPRALVGIVALALLAGGYVRGDLREPEPGADAYAFTYDWRRDLVEAAQRLSEAVDRVVAASGDPNVKIRLLCHSAGGLVARYYVKYGGVDVLDQSPLPAPTYAGAAHVEKVIMLGTPNAGSLEAFQRVHEGLALPTIGRLPPEALITMPALYQLFPHDGRSVFVDASGQPLAVDLYDAANWERYGWSVFAPKHQRRNASRRDAYRAFLARALTRAQRFHEALAAGDPAEEAARVSYVVMGADCEPTLQRAILEPDGFAWRVRFNSPNASQRELLYGFGDRSVTRHSLLGLRDPGEGRPLPSVHGMFFCEGHSDLAGNITFMDNVLHTMMEE